MLKRYLKRLVKPVLDPGRVEKVFHEYEHDRGFGWYHDYCRKAFKRTLPEGSVPLVESGFERLRVMSEAEAANTLRTIQERYTPEPYRKHAHRVESFPIDDPQFIEELLESALTPEVDDRAARFFESEYLVYWFVVNGAMPLPDENRNAFLWHCDTGPRAHLKLLVYLNSAEEHGGNTAFLDIEETRDIARSGYIFGSMAERREDLSALAEQVGTKFAPKSWSVAAGEAFLFQPSNVLHRGVMPSGDPRYVLHVLLLPSPVPWKEALRRQVMIDITQDEKWHRDARELVRGLGLAPA